MAENIRIDRFLDSEGRITLLPSKQKSRLAVLEYLAEKYRLGCTYTEQQVNEICNRWHTFGDFYMLRRELIDYGFLARERDGSKYWRVWEKPTDNEE